MISFRIPIHLFLLYFHLLPFALSGFWLGGFQLILGVFAWNSRLFKQIHCRNRFIAYSIPRPPSPVCSLQPLHFPSSTFYLSNFSCTSLLTVLHYSPWSYMYVFLISFPYTELILATISHSRHFHIESCTILTGTESSVSVARVMVITRNLYLCVERIKLTSLF